MYNWKIYNETNQKYEDAYKIYLKSYQSAKNHLNGGVAIFLGDSYIYGLKERLEQMATKYALVADNRGVVSSTISGDYDINTDTGNGYQQMWKRADAIVNEYTSETGYTINDVSYNANDVKVIFFMGGANDGFGEETWIGSGINDTDITHIYGACNHIFNVLQENFPNARLIVVTQPSSYNRLVSDFSDEETAIKLGFDSLEQLQLMTDVQFSNYAMAKKENAVKEVAMALGCYVKDVFCEFPSVFNPSNREKYWSSDKLHLSTEGNQFVVDKMEDALIDIFG